MINRLTNYWNIRLISIPAFIAGFLLIFSSCIKEEFNADILDPSLQINPGVAAPIGWARYQLDEILTDSLNADELVIDENGFLSFVYNQDLYSLQASEIISIPDTTVSGYSIESPASVPLILTNNTIFNDTLEFSIPLNGAAGAEIDSILFRSGFISYTVTSHYPGTMWQTKILLQGIPNSQVTLDDSNPTGTDTLSLSGKILPLNNTPPAQNAITIVVQLTVFASDTTVTISPGPILDIDIELNELVYGRIYGYLGQFDLDIDPQSFPVNFYNRIPEGSFHFNNPRLKLEFLSSFGLPVQVSMNNFHATGSGGLITPITGSGVPDQANPKILAYPQYGQEGESIRDSIVLTPDNTNLFDIESLTQITIGVNGTTNPAGPPGENFILDTSRLRVSTELILPMEGYADLILISDTLDFIMGEFFDNPPEEIIRLLFRINYEHQFPVKVETQLYFTDDSYTVLDSLFHDLSDVKRIVQGAPDNNGDGVADEFEPDPIEIELSREQIDNIAESHHIIFKGRVRTTGYEPPPPVNVRFYSFYYFFAHIGAIAELEINSNDY